MKRILGNVDATDLLAAVGLGCVGVGTWLLSPAVSLIVVGSILLAAVAFSLRPVRSAK